MDYPDACRSLAKKLGDYAQLGADQSILDVGCGCGEQIRLWREAFQCGRIHGVDPSKKHLERAQSLTEGMQNLNLESASSERLVLEKESYDRVLCLDSAYHFPMRAHFWGRAFQSLKNGGYLALTDLILDKDAKLQSKLRDASTALCGIPPENLVKTEDYRSQLEKAGFTDITIHFVDEAVFGGFASFVDRIGRAYRREVRQLDWLKIWLTAKACRFFLKSGALHYSFISARKTL